MPRPIRLGQSSFTQLREEGGYYVDKSSFVSEVLTAPMQVALYPRPRRFGKTLNMTMLRAFFEIGPDRSGLFEDLSIWKDVEACTHFQRHPVISLTFKDVVEPTWPEARRALNALLSAEVERHAAAVADPRVPPGLRARLEAVIAGTDHQGRVLLDLCQALEIHHGEKAILLIDEYDAVVLTAWDLGYYDEAVLFFRSLLSSGLKGNDWLFRGVMTGILQLARESMFSGLNNVEVYSLLKNRADEQFGFTEDEVIGVLGEFGRSEEATEVRDWYNGYRFGRATVYNPISIMSMLAYPDEPLLPYWLNTSANLLVRKLLLAHMEIDAGVAMLLGGGSVESQIQEEVPLRDLNGRHVWGLLLFSGYLRAENVRVEEARTFADLRIPNREVRGLWQDTFSGWLEQQAGSVEPLHRAVLTGDAPAVEEILQTMLLRHVSFHDTAANQDEAFYHAFVLGLLVTLEKSHAVRSNRESGRGRPDLLIIPKRPGLAGVALEFKRRQRVRVKIGEPQPPPAEGELEGLAKAALEQIQDRAYVTELESAGAAPICRLGIAFSGQDVVVRGE